MMQLGAHSWAAARRGVGVERRPRRAAQNAPRGLGGLGTVRRRKPPTAAGGRRLPIVAAAPPPTPKGGDNRVAPNIRPAKAEYVPPTLLEIAAEEWGPPVKKVWRKVAKPLSSLPLAIAELTAITAMCILGTIIEQGKPPIFYFETYPADDKLFGFLYYDFILGLGLDRMFSTWYFIGSLVLLGASLAACSSTTQWPMLKVARRWNFLERKTQFYRLDVAQEVDRARVGDLSQGLAERGYQVFCKGEGKMYAYKGLVGRLAPIAVHVSLLLVLAGSGYSAIATINGTNMTPQGTDFDIAGAFRVNDYTRAPDLKGDRIFVNKFEIDNYQSGAVSQFYSDLSVVDVNGNEKYRKRISVNDPLRYDGVTMYQTDWAISSVVVRAEGGVFGDGADFRLPMASLEGREGYNGRIWGSFLPTSQEAGSRTGISILARDLNSVVLYKENGEFAGVRRPDSGKTLDVEGVTITVKDLVGATGLELKMDPGVPIIYAGYGALIVTTFVAYLSHSQVWAMQEGATLVVGGKSNRAKLDFERELGDVLDKLPEAA